MTHLSTTKTATGRANDRGSAILIAVFAMVILTGIGVVLLFITQTDVRVNKTDHDVKSVFYGSEAALERGREELRQWQIASGTIGLNDELARAAGLNGVIDFDPANVQPIYDTDGNVTGFTGAGDDEPVRTFTMFERGAMAAYLTNDPADGRTALADSNRRLMVTGVSVVDNSSFEIVEAVVDQFGEIPDPSAAITILGDNPVFQGGSSSAKKLSGDDCLGYGTPGLSVPVVGVIGSSAETLAEAGVDKPSTFTEGAETGVDTVDDIETTIDPKWKDCEWIVSFAERYRAMSDIVGDTNTPQGSLGTPGNEKIVFIDGDYTISGSFNGSGALWVTGTLTMDGKASWSGPVFVIGTGKYLRDGFGNGYISGANYVANVSGPDQKIFTADDCSGDDGTHGTADDGLGSGAEWYTNGAGNGTLTFCEAHLNIWRLRVPFEVVDFRQR